MSERLTSGTESGSWPTPNTQDCEAAGSSKHPMLTHAARMGRTVKADGSGDMWPTPAASEGGSNGNAPGENGPRRPSLEGAARLWPTATAMDCIGSGSAGYSTESGRRPGTTLTDAANGLWVTPTTRDWKGSSAAQGTRGTPENPVGVNLPTQVHRVDGPPVPESRSTDGKPPDWGTPTAHDRTHTPRPVHHGTQLANQVRGQLNPAWVAQLQGLPDGWLDLDPAEVEALFGARNSKR
jgi:hypothetical protein